MTGDSGPSRLSPSERVGVIGGGMTGLALAYRLARQGFRVHVLERGSQLGGLAGSANYGAFHWDRFYHVILPSDENLIALIEGLGLKDDFVWTATKTGYYVDGRMHSLTTAADLLRFPLLGLLDKFRLGLTMLYGSRIRDRRAMEQITAAQWLQRVSGRRTYEKFWRPLLLAKLGEAHTRVSAVFIWTYIKRLYSARSAVRHREALGHVRGGYKSVFERLEREITAAGGSVELNFAASRIEACTQGGLSAHRVDGARRDFDKVVFTGPVDALIETAPSLAAVERNGAVVEYLGVVCLVLVTERQVTPFYTLNIADPAVPFTGAIGMSSVVPRSSTSGLWLTYLPRYVASDDPLLGRDSQAVTDEFLAGARRLFPHLDSCGIAEVRLHRARRVQPLQTIDYSRRVPTVRTKHPDFFVLNTAQLVESTLNNDAVVRQVNEFVAEYVAPTTRADV